MVGAPSQESNEINKTLKLRIVLGGFRKGAGGVEASDHFPVLLDSFRGGRKGGKQKA